MGLWPDLAKLDTRRRGKLLALEVGARITSADQKCFEIPATEDEGLDMELEFTNDDGEGTGRRLYLQLKSGNSYLTKRKTDGAEIFTIKKQRWVEYWLQQPHPVMLVIGTFSEDAGGTVGEGSSGRDGGRVGVGLQRESSKSLQNEAVWIKIGQGFAPLCSIFAEKMLRSPSRMVRSRFRMIRSLFRMVCSPFRAVR